MRDDRLDSRGTGDVELTADGVLEAGSLGLSDGNEGDGEEGELVHGGRRRRRRKRKREGVVDGWEDEEQKRQEGGYSRPFL